MRITVAAITGLLLAVAVPEASAQVAAAVDDAQREQISRLIDGVHNRVRDAAEAARYVVEAEQHRRESERMAEAGRHEQARAELQFAAEVVAARNLGIEGDLLFQDYVSKLREALSALDSREKPDTDSTIPRAVNVHLAPTFIKDILKANALPAELLAVVMVESAGDPTALSPKGARGLWQLMPDTARRYGLRVNEALDERLDPLKSTYAAVRYLTDLYGMFHDWPLALAAYNAGESRIQRVMERTGLRRFSEMADRRLLPAETIQYVPAVLNLMRRPGSRSSQIE